MAILRYSDLIAQIFQMQRNQLGDVGLVLDDQNASPASSLQTSLELANDIVPFPPLAVPYDVLQISRNGHRMIISCRGSITL